MMLDRAAEKTQKRDQSWPFETRESLEHPLSFQTHGKVFQHKVDSEHSALQHLSSRSKKTSYCSIHPYLQQGAGLAMLGYR